MKHGEAVLFTVYGCSEGEISGKQSWIIFPNDKPAVDSIISYETNNNTSITQALMQTHPTFILAILKPLHALIKL